MRNGIKGRGIIAFVCIGLLLCACSEDAAPVSAAVQENEFSNCFVITEQDRKTAKENAEELNLDSGDGIITITDGGDYLLYGSLEGQLVIDTYEDELVHLYLDGIDITSSAGPAINVVSASKLIMTLVSGSENVLSDTVNYKGYENTKSCLYSAVDLTINGEGALTVYGYHADGLRSKDRIKILGGTIDVQAKGDGIRGNDGIAMSGGVIKIQSEGDGMRTVNQGADSKGVIEIYGGTLDITSGQSGIHTVSDLYIRDCECNIYTVEEKVRVEGTRFIEEKCIN